MLEALNSTVSVLERYTFGPGIDEPLGQTTSNPQYPKIFYEADGLGSITSQTNPLGQVVGTIPYTEFGSQIKSGGQSR